MQEGMDLGDDRERDGFAPAPAERQADRRAQAAGRTAAPAMTPAQ